MKNNISLTDNKNCISISNIVKAERRKATDTQVARAIIFTTIFLTVVMFIVSIIRFENSAPWTKAFMGIASPATTLLPIVFILLICEEWTRGTALVTYTFIPQRNKVIWAKLIILFTFFIGAIVIIYALSAIAAMIAGGVYSYSINWSESFVGVISLALPLLINMLFGFSMAVVTQETTIALAMYFIIPPVTVIFAQLPTVGKFMKWFSLEHSSSLFIAGASEVSTAQYISSIVIWIILPIMIGILRNQKRDLD